MGFDIERFVGPVNEGLLCCIYRDVLEEPVQAPCEHAYCSTCVHAWLTHYNTCPEDRQSLWPSDLKPIFRYMKNDLDGLKIRCDNRLKGCTAVVRLGNLPRHLKEDCDYTAVKCPNVGCTESLNRCDLETHLIICDFQTAKCTKGCGLQINMNEIALHNCITELRKTIEKQKSDFEAELRDLKRCTEEKFDAQRLQMVYKESTLQNQVEDLKTQVGEVVSEIKSLKLKETQKAVVSRSEERETKEIIEWMKGLKYQDEISEKYCGTCNKRFLHIRKEPLTTFRDHMCHSPSSDEDAFLTSLRTARQKPRSHCQTHVTNYAPDLMNLTRSNGEESCLDRSAVESWRRATDMRASPVTILSRDGRAGDISTLPH